MKGALDLLYVALRTECHLSVVGDLSCLPDLPLREESSFCCWNLIGSDIPKSEFKLSPVRVLHCFLLVQNGKAIVVSKGQKQHSMTYITYCVQLVYCMEQYVTQKCCTYIVDKWKLLARIAGHTRENRASFVIVDFSFHHYRDSIASLEPCIYIKSF